MDENKYLSKLLKKGVRGKFNSLLKWLKLIEDSYSIFMNLLINDEKAVSIFLNTLKHGLLSKSDDIKSYAKKMLAQIIKDLLDFGFQNTLWSWLCQEHGGLETCLIAYKKSEDFILFILESILPIAKGNFLNFFNIELRKIISDQNQYISFIHNFLDIISKEKAYEKEVIQFIIFVLFYFF